jgi:hypothetical protein
VIEDGAVTSPRMGPSAMDKVTKAGPAKLGIWGPESHSGSTGCCRVRG